MRPLWNELYNEMTMLGNAVVAMMNCEDKDCANRLFDRIVNREI